MFSNENAELELALIRPVPNPLEQLSLADLRRAARRQLASYRLFVADPDVAGGGLRLGERLEAGIMDSLYHQPPAFWDLPDRGMFQQPGPH